MRRSALLFAYLATLWCSAVAQQPSPVVPTIVDTEQLRLDFTSNMLAAERKYGGGRQLVVLGIMRSIHEEHDGDTVIVFTGVEAHLRPNMVTEAATYRQGEELQLICVLGKQRFWVQLRDCRSPNMDGVPEAASAPQPPPLVRNSGIPMLVSAAQYLADYEANTIAADLRYKDRTLSIFGTVRLVGRTLDGVPYVSLSADSSDLDFAAVDALLAPAMVDEATTFRRGQRLQLVCIGGARLGESDLPALRDCHSP